MQKKRFHKQCNREHRGNIHKNDRLKGIIATLRRENESILEKLKKKEEKETILINKMGDLMEENNVLDDEVMIKGCQENELQDKIEMMSATQNTLITKLRGTETSTEQSRGKIQH